MTPDEKRLEALKLAISCVGDTVMPADYVTEVALSFYRFLDFEDEKPTDPKYVSTDLQRNCVNPMPVQMSGTAWETDLGVAKFP
jgi:hypothetical protein